MAFGGTAMLGVLGMAGLVLPSVAGFEMKMK
jgi:hypothetical protein